MANTSKSPPSFRVWRAAVSTVTSLVSPAPRVRNSSEVRPLVSSRILIPSKGILVPSIVVSMYRGNGTNLSKNAVLVSSMTAHMPQDKEISKLNLLPLFEKTLTFSTGLASSKKVPLLSRLSVRFPWFVTATLTSVLPEALRTMFRGESRLLRSTETALL